MNTFATIASFGFPMLASFITGTLWYFLEEETQSYELALICAAVTTIFTAGVAAGLQSFPLTLSIPLALGLGFYMSVFSAACIGK